MQPCANEGGASLFFTHVALEDADALVQHFCLVGLARHHYVLPRTPPLAWHHRIEGRESVVLSVGLLVADVEPLVSPPLDEHHELDIEIGGGGVDMDSAASYVVDYRTRC